MKGLMVLGHTHRTRVQLSPVEDVFYYTEDIRTIALASFPQNYSMEKLTEL
jgi:hypothetical protein